MSAIPDNLIHMSLPTEFQFMGRFLFNGRKWAGI